LTCQRDLTIRGLSYAAVCAAVLCATGSGAARQASGTGPVAGTGASGARAIAAPGIRASSAPGARASASTAPGQPAAKPPLTAGQVLGHVNQTVDWYRQTQDVERLPELAQDVVAYDRLRQAALAVVQRAFAFGHAAVPLVAANTAPGAAQPQAGLNQAIARINDRITALQAQLSQIDSRLAGASGQARTALRAQRNDINAALALEREVQSTLADLQRFQTSALVTQAHGPQDLLGQIEDLERSVPEARQAAGGGNASANPNSQSDGSRATASKAANATAPAGSPSSNFRPESAGIIALIGEWFSLEGANGRLGSLASATNRMEKELAALRAPLIAQARSLISADTAAIDTQDTAQLDSVRLQLEDAANRFKQLATLLVPLGDQNFVLDDARGAIREWRDTIGGRLDTVGRYLLVKAGLLAFGIAVVLVISEISKRATFRYSRDVRRRSQFQTLRRVAVGVALVFVLVFGLVSQLGSLATYVGFLTAGLAVALQNVILSIVAYFFLIGRYGVRVGDRITLAGVTGRVVDIGLIRLYLMELAGTDLHSTGRVVVMSNSVLFQPQALFKQIPGANYPWHTVSVTLAASVDMQAAQKRLEAAADSVYEHYRGAIEEQHAAVQRLIDFETSLPRPEVRVGFAENGLEFAVRFPVQAGREATIDQMMLQAVRDALAQEPKLPVATGGEPSLKRSEA
jgi:small-conductance mechanosensitive channel